VNQTSYALQYASDELKNNHDFILEAMKVCGEVFRSASTKVRCDMMNGFPLTNVISDENLVLEAVKQNSLALKFVSCSLKSNTNINH